MLLLKPFRSATYQVAGALAAGTYTPYDFGVEGLFIVNTTIQSSTATDQVVVQTWSGAAWSAIAYSNGQAINFYRNLNFQYVGLGCRIVVIGATAIAAYSVTRIK